MRGYEEWFAECSTLEAFVLLLVLSFMTREHGEATMRRILNDAQAKYKENTTARS